MLLFITIPLLVYSLPDEQKKLSENRNATQHDYDALELTDDGGGNSVDGNTNNLADVDDDNENGGSTQSTSNNNNQLSQLLGDASCREETTINTNNNNDNNTTGAATTITRTIFIPRDSIGNKGMLIKMVANGHLVFRTVSDIGEWEDLHAELIRLNEEEYLLIQNFLRGAASSGSNWARVRPILEKIPSFRKLINKLETVFQIRHGWVLAYTKDGRHPFHNDAEYHGVYRMILTLGAFDKWFWFRKNEKTNSVKDMFAVKLEHGSTVFMSSEGGGYNSLVQHAALGNAEGSWFLALELRPRPDISHRLFEQFIEDMQLQESGAEGDAAATNYEMDSDTEDEEKKEEAEEEDEEDELQQALALSLQPDVPNAGSLRGSRPKKEEVREDKEEEKKEEVDESVVYETETLSEEDIDLVQTAANVSRARAIKALQENDGDAARAFHSLL